MKFKKMAAVAVGIVLLLSGCSLWGGKNPEPDKEKIPGALHQFEGIKSLEAGNSNSNITNMGGAAFDGKNIYYQNSQDGLKIYKADKKGENPVKISDTSAYFINVIEDWIYYCNGDDNFHIYRMKTDGSQNELIYDHAAYYLVIENGFMYFSDWDDNKTLYRMELDGSKKWQLSEIEAYYINVVDDDVYYCNYDDNEDNYGIYTVNFVTKQTERICPYICGYLNVTDSYIYFTDMKAGINRNGTDGLYRINRANYSESERIIDKDCGIFNCSKGYIYYVNYGDEDKIYRCDEDGKNSKLFVDEQAKFITVANKKLYYMHVVDDDTFEVKNADLKAK